MSRLFRQAGIYAAHTSTPPAIPAGPSTPAGMLSGASGSGAADGGFGTWRNNPVQVVPVWATTSTDLAAWTDFQTGGQVADWTGPVDVGFGPLDTGETWTQAAAGVMDTRWGNALQQLATLRAGRGTTYLRFAWEMNGSWFPWAVNGSNLTDFITAWRRFRSLQLSYFPAGKVVFCVNRSTSTGTAPALDWRRMFPGATYVDLMGVDYYNRYPYAGSTAAFTTGLTQTDGFGAPYGLERHRQYAASVGLPLTVAQWAGSADDGDSPAFIQGMHDYFTSYAGSGPGQVAAEAYFNVVQDGNKWHLHDPAVATRMPQSAALYQQLF